MQPLPYFRPDATFREAAGLEHARDYLKTSGLEIRAFLPHDGAHNMAPIVASDGDTLHLVMVRVFSPGQSRQPNEREIRHARRILTGVLNEVMASDDVPRAVHADVLAIEVDDSPDGRSVALTYSPGVIAPPGLIGRRQG